MGGGSAQRGMTLVEVLVALAIMGAVAAAILGLIAQNTRFMASVETQTVADMLADKEMVEAMARRAPLERGVTESDSEFGGRRFHVKRTVTETGVENLVRIDLVIADASGRQVLASATTIKSEGQR